MKFALVLSLFISFFSCKTEKVDSASYKSGKEKSNITEQDLINLHLKNANLNRSLNHYLFFFSLFQSSLDRNGPNRFNLHFAKRDLKGGDLALDFKGVVNADFRQGYRNFIIPMGHMYIKGFHYFALKTEKSYGVRCIAYHFSSTNGEPYRKWIKAYNSEVRKKLIEEKGTDLLAVIEKEWDDARRKLFKK